MVFFIYKWNGLKVLIFGKLFEQLRLEVREACLNQIQYYAMIFDVLTTL